MQEPMRIKKNGVKHPSQDPGVSVKAVTRRHPLLKMQESIGNRALLHLRGSLETMQTKLSVGQPHDMYEQEADTVARRIVNQISRNDISALSQQRSQSVHMLQKQSDETLSRCGMTEDVQRQEEEEILPVQSRQSEQVQRQPEEEEEMPIQPRLSEQVQRQEEEEEMPIQPRLSERVQRQEEEEYALEKHSRQDHTDTGATGGVSADLENQVNRERKGGEALDASTRFQMQSGFGYDFSRVKLHNDSIADHLSRQLNAEAFTIKDDIFFRSGRYNPTTTHGQDLLAHELTHVVQQGGAASYDRNTAEL